MSGSHESGTLTLEQMRRMVEMAHRVRPVVHPVWGWRIPPGWAARNLFRFYRAHGWKLALRLGWFWPWKRYYILWTRGGTVIAPLAYHDGGDDGGVRRLAPDG